MYSMLSEEELIAKWSDPQLGKNSVVGLDFEKQHATAQILENIVQYSKSQRNPFGLLNEASSVAPSSTATGQFQPITLSIARRVLPELFAWKTVGVQPMAGPVGVAYAMRFRYKGTSHEAGFDNMPYWSSLTGNLSGTSGAADAGTGVSTATAEAWSLSDSGTMPQIVFAMEQVAITAKSRKVAANVTLEALMDVKAMHNVDIKRQLVERLQYQLRAETDREIVGAIKAAAVDTANGGETATTWQVSASDGRWQQEKFSTVANMIMKKGNDLAQANRVGAGNFVVVSPNVATALQASNTNIFNGNTNTVNPSNIYADVGTINGQIKVYVDRYAVTDYAVVGFKGMDGQNECGVIYSPYVIGLEAEAVTQEDFSPRLGVMSRYGLTSSLLGSGRYYRQINFVNLNLLTNGQLS